MSEPSLEHLARILSVLRVLAGCDSPARAMVVCEDVYIACSLGLTAGLTMEQIVASHGEVVSEIAAEQLKPSR